MSETIEPISSELNITFIWQVKPSFKVESVEGIEG